MDPNSSASEALEWIYRNAGDMIANGFTDDNIGEINQFHDAEIGSTSCDSSNGSFRLYYRIEEVSSDLRRGRGRDM